MANQNDSFIDEVTDELRRDRLFATFRRYGWIAALVILGIVGGAIWREVSISRALSEAQAFGDAVLAAETGGDPAALSGVETHGVAGRKAILGMIAAGEMAAAGDAAGAAAALQDAATAVDGIDPVLHDLAQLKLVILQGATMEPAMRDQMLTELSRAGAPFELLALEQKAVALIGAGRKDDAVTLIRQIQAKAGVSEALRRRLSEMMIALGVEPEPTDSLMAE
ncbi:hypothetical protein [Paracoccus sp. (in: a-proteobacteria)]|uniref:hypothetical protein n=1 Tax=Paracoccus sp. TaxID=267 RepID=UPI003A89FFB1